MFSQRISFEAVRSALSSVLDPVMKKDVVTLGAVKNLQINSSLVKFDILLSASGTQAEKIRQECEKRVLDIKGVKTVEVGILSRPGPNANQVKVPTIRNVIAIVSGKGGVGKSTVATNLAVALSQNGSKVGLMDADVYGPSIPLMFGVSGKEIPNDSETAVPLESYGVKLISIGFFIPEDKPVVWRGPRVHSVLTQFLTHVNWGELDYLLVDMPPGTGDAQLTLSQNIPLAGVVVVTTPQNISLIDARKGLEMFKEVNVPVLGIIENMSGFVCSHCGELTNIFKKGGGESIACSTDVPLLGSIPLDPRLTEGGDKGCPLVNEYPDSRVGKIYFDIADRIASQLSIPNAESSGAFKPLSLEW